jgi:hypothetical protein
MRHRADRTIVALASLVALVLPLASTAAQASGAQQTNSAAIEGTVYDSLSHAPLRDAAVSFVAAAARTTSYNARSDSSGHYVLQNVQPGTYLVGFLHPLLDSIGIEPPTHRVTVSASSRAMHVDLAVPSGQRIHDAVCGAPAKGDSSGVFVGHVQNTLTRELASGAEVTAQWAKYGVTNGKISLTWPTLVAKTTPDGWFAFCGLPPDASISFIAVAGSDSSGVVRFDVPAHAVVHHDFYVARAERITRTFAPESTSATDSSRTLSQTLLRGPVRLRGIVEDATRSRPLSGVQVGIVGTGLTAVSNEQGEFTLAELPPGTQSLFARKIGYLPWEQAVNLFADDTSRLVLKIPTLKSVLDTVKITATRNMDPTGFYRRKQTGLGHYLDANQIAKMRPYQTSDLLWRMPSIRPSVSGFDRIALMSNRMGGFCQPTVYVDGMRMMDMTLTDLDMMVLPEDVVGIETYTSLVGTPPEFLMSFADCGSIIVWTRPRNLRKR